MRARCHLGALDVINPISGLLTAEGRSPRDVLTVEQHLQIATVYEKAAADRMGVPPQQRAAFARKAKWFRTLARIRAKKRGGDPLPPKRSGAGRIVLRPLQRNKARQVKVGRYLLLGFKLLQSG